jgi:hypothetical protein
VSERIALIALGLTALLSAVWLPLTAASAADAPTISDIAVIESYTRMASQGHLLVGAYSRFQWHHPGPLPFYVLAPFYVASGMKNAGLNAGAAVVNVTCLAYIMAVLVRRRPLLAAAVGAGLAMLAWRTADALVSPWNPHMTVLPLLAVVAGAADVLAGAARGLPFVALFASLAGQAHVALMPCVLVAGSAAAIRAVFGCSSLAASRWRGSVIATVIVLLACWGPTLYEQVIGTPHGNLTELWTFFIGQRRAGQSLGVALSAWSDMFVGIVRPDFSVARGARFVESPVLWAEWLAVGTVAVIAVTGVESALRRRVADRFDAALSILLVLSSAVALWSATRIAEHIFDHDVYWIAGLGALNLCVAAERVYALARRTWFGADAAAGDDQRRWRLLAVLFACVAASAPAWAMQRVVERSARPEPRALAARFLADDIEFYTRAHQIGRPLLVIDEDAWEVAAGAILDLQKRGRAIAVEDGWVVMFTPQTRANGRETATIRLVTPAGREQVRASFTPISEREPVQALLLGR